MKERIYLIGQISSAREITYHWRKEVSLYFKDEEAFDIIDPCDNEWNSDSDFFNFNGSDSKTSEQLKVYNRLGSGLIVPKDHSYVLRSSGCIANMNRYDANKPIIGTLFELAWYYQNPEKCVIGVFSDDWTSDTHCNHPFVRETVDVWCKDHMEAAHLLKYYYKRGIT